MAAQTRWDVPEADVDEFRLVEDQLESLTLADQLREVFGVAEQSVHVLLQTRGALVGKQWNQSK